MPDNKKPIAYEAYCQLADDYDRLIETKPHNAYYDKPAVISLWPELRDRRVLDAGCGPGSYTRKLLDRGANVLAFDIVETMIEHAKRRVADCENQNIEFHLLDMEQELPFDSESFDFVNAPLCLDYVQDWTRLFKEFCRVLRPGGMFVFSCGHPSFDAAYFKTTNYFSVEQVSCEWTGFGNPVVVPSFRRSLEQSLMPVINAGMVIDRVLEPLPTEEFKQADLRRYKILMHRPGFLCVRAKRV